MAIVEVRLLFFMHPNIIQTLRLRKHTTEIRENQLKIFKRLAARNRGLTGL